MYKIGNQCYDEDMKKTFSSAEKATIALIAIKGELTTAQIASRHEVHPTQIGHWRNQALEILKRGFTDKRKKENHEQERRIADLYQTIGQRDMELQWLKKKIGFLESS